MDVVFYRDRRNTEPVLSYFRATERSGDGSASASLERVLRRIREEGAPLGMPLDRLIEPRLRLYEIRIGPHRVAYWQNRGYVVLLHAWRKRSQKLDGVEVATAVRRTLDWMERLG
jgi:phage-related protein